MGLFYSTLSTRLCLEGITRQDSYKTKSGYKVDSRCGFFVCFMWKRGGNNFPLTDILSNCDWCLEFMSQLHRGQLCKPFWYEWTLWTISLYLISTKPNIIKNTNLTLLTFAWSLTMCHTSKFVFLKLGNCWVLTCMVIWNMGHR